MRPTYVEIDLSSIKTNLEQTKKLISPDVSILAVVKADAYGHGAVKVSETLISSGIEMLGVATVEEALELREAGIDSKIYLLGGIQNYEIENVAKYDLVPTVYLVDTLDSMSSYAEKHNIILKFHLKIDTGMTRLGVSEYEIKKFLNALSKFKNLVMEGVFTHLASADFDDEYTNYQIDSFNNLISIIKSFGHTPTYLHLANSAAIQRFPRSHKNLVRPGIMLYGTGSFNGTPLSPTMRLKTKIIQLKTVPENTHVSYGGTFVTKKPSTLAILPIGYADGYLRILSNRAFVSVKGHKAPVVGTVCMDFIVIDVTDISNLKVGDEVVLFGDVIISVDDVAMWADTIPYEVMTIIGKRVERKFIDETTV